MGIESVSGLKQILSNHESKKWVDSASKAKNIQEFDFNKGVSDKSIDGQNSKTFGEFLTDSMTKVNDLQGVANHAMEKLATGESKNLHETMIMVEKADIAFRSMNQIRMKVIDAYREVMKMQV